MKGTVKLEANDEGVAIETKLMHVGSNDKANLLRAFLQGIQLDYSDAVVMIAAIMAHDAKEGEDE